MVNYCPDCKRPWRDWHRVSATKWVRHCPKCFRIQEAETLPDAQPERPIEQERVFA